MAGKLKITLVKSPIGAVPKQKATVVAVSYTHLDVYKRQEDTQETHRHHCSKPEDS